MKTKYIQFFYKFWLIKFIKFTKIKKIFTLNNQSTNMRELSIHGLQSIVFLVLH